MYNRGVKRHNKSIIYNPGVTRYSLATLLAGDPLLNEILAKYPHTHDNIYEKEMYCFRKKNINSIWHKIWHKMIPRNMRKRLPIKCCGSSGEGKSQVKPLPTYIEYKY